MQTGTVVRQGDEGLGGGPGGGDSRISSEGKSRPEEILHHESVQTEGVKHSMGV